MDSSLIFKNGAKFKRIDNNSCVVYFWVHVFYCPFFIIVTYKILHCKSQNQLQKIALVPVAEMDMENLITATNMLYFCHVSRSF